MSGHNSNEIKFPASLFLKFWAVRKMSSKNKNMELSMPDVSEI